LIVDIGKHLGAKALVIRARLIAALEALRHPKAGSAAADSVKRVGILRLRAQDEKSWEAAERKAQ
jgi:hypothetical protein